jgi:circadian clock protein KaiC
MSTLPPEGTPMLFPPGSLEPTGIPQLDLLLAGGIAQGALVLIIGPPGSGKTTLASQIAFAQAKRGRNALFLTVHSEPTTKLLSHLKSYHFFAPDLIGNAVQMFSLQQFLTQGTLPTVQEMAAQVRQTQAHILILDGFQGVRGGGTNHQIIRQMLYDWGTSLGLQGITTLVTVEGTPRDPATFPEMTTSDVLIGLYFRLQGVRTLRSVEVIKARGSAPLLGQHSLALSDEGIRIFPRLESRVKLLALENQKGDTPNFVLPKRVSFGLPALDAVLGGGLTHQTSTLLAGSLGTGKTLLALQFALAGVSSGEPVVLLSFRETGEQLLEKAADFVFADQLRAAFAPDGGITLQRWEPIELDPDEIMTSLLAAIEQTGARRVVIDSITEIERAVQESSGPERLPNFLAALLAALRLRHVTLLVTKEISKGISTRLDFSGTEVSILAENVLLVQQLAYGNQLRNVLSVLVMRFSGYDSSLLELQITAPEGIRVLIPKESEAQDLAGLAWQQRDLKEKSPPWTRRTVSSEREQ